MWLVLYIAQNTWSTIDAANKQTRNRNRNRTSKRATQPATEHTSTPEREHAYIAKNRVTNKCMRDQATSLALSCAPSTAEGMTIK